MMHMHIQGPLLNEGKEHMEKLDGLDLLFVGHVDVLRSSFVLGVCRGLNS